MSMQRTVLLGLAGWLIAISLLHGGLNLGLFDRSARRERRDEAPFRVGFIPVTCHLTCPVTHFINEQLMGDGIFEPIRFSGWPELKETFLANDLEATFILAPAGHVAARAGRADQDRLSRPPRRHDDDGPQGLDDPSASKICAAARSPCPTGSPTRRLIIFKALQGAGHEHPRRHAPRDAAARHARCAVSPDQSTRSSPASHSWPRPRWTATAACSS